MTEVAAEKSFAVIIRGRMPVACVALAKKLANAEGASNSTVAAQFNTTVGKIHDIKTGRCFGYIDDNFKPTAEQITEGVNWLKRHKDGEAAVTDLVDQLNDMDVATEEEAKAFLEKRAGSRTKAEPKIDPETGEPVKTKRGRKPKAEKPAAPEVPDTAGDGTDVDDLLS